MAHLMDPPTYAALDTNDDHAHPSDVFGLREHPQDDRAEAEDFILQRFAQAFGCSVRAFMPRLFTLRGADGAIRGALGLRPAGQELFLERYLDSAIEQEVFRYTGQPCERKSIVEVGHFSGEFPGAVRVMIAQLTQLLRREGFEWVAFTGTSCLRNTFGRLGLAPVEIAIAQADRLPSEERSSWGSYYDQSPRVFIGCIKEGWHLLGHSPVFGDTRAVPA